MNSILQGLSALYAECENRGAATMAALLTIMIEGAKYMDTLWTVERREYSSLKDRVKDLEQATGAAPGGAGGAAPGGAGADGHVVNPNEPSDHDLFLAGQDLGSNNGVSGQFSSPALVANNVNTTGIGAAGTMTFINLTTGDRQLVRSHALSFNTSGTIVAGVPSAAVKLGSVTWGPSLFARPPKVELTPLNSDASGPIVYVVPNVGGYDVWNSAGTLVTAKSYQYAVTVTPN